MLKILLPKHCTYKRVECLNEIYREDLCKQHHYYKVKGWAKKKR